MPRSSRSSLPAYRWLVPTLLAGLALAATSPASGQAPAQAAPVTEEQGAEEQRTEEQGAAPPAGLRAFVDPETGELTSTPSRQQVEGLSRAVAASLEAGLSRSSEGLEPFELRAGGRGVNLRGRFYSALVARRLEGGEIELVCRDVDSEPAHEHLAPVAGPLTWAEK